jgi:sugar transferase (PEP-CTERM/EpsH1 system associated)
MIGQRSPPLVVHVVHRFDTGGLENGVVNLINHMHADAYSHAVVALTEVSPIFRRRVQRSDVAFYALHKAPGQGFWRFPQFFALLRRLQPAVVHTRNLGTLEFQVAAAMAGVRGRVHGEHGRDIDDLDGSSRRHRWTRRTCRPFVQRWVALSADLRRYLEGPIGVPAAAITHIYNGVDSRRFRPADAQGPEPVPGCPFKTGEHWLVGTVGRMQTVKAQTLLAQAFVLALQREPALRSSARLVMVGDGPLRAEVQAILDAAGLGALAWLPGERADVPELMRHLDCFVLPSLAEGVSNTILEAMASGVAVVATDVGANADLVQAGNCGVIVRANDPADMATALLARAADRNGTRAMGAAGRHAAVQRFSIEAMADSYRSLYDELLRPGSARP